MLSRRRLLKAALAVPFASLAGCTASSVREGTRPSARQSVRTAPSAARRVRVVIDAQGVTDGAGVHLARSLGSGALPYLDPFLMLDEFRSENPGDYIAGFPSHPHRGFETVTYMLAGAMEHRDSLGNQGRLSPGSVQWMTAGHGIVHSEMPKQERGLMHGFQLWVNLPRSRKMVPPRYQDLPAESVVQLHVQDSEVRLLAGMVGEQRGPVAGIVTDPHVLDVTLPRRGRFEHPMPETHNAFAYVIEGSVRFEADGADVTRGRLAVLEPGVALARVTSRDGGRFLLLAGAPIGEPVARRGPFVMNTERELDLAVEEYRAGTLTRI